MGRFALKVSSGRAYDAATERLAGAMIPQLPEDVLAAMARLGTERQAMVTLSFNPYDGNRTWMATIGLISAVVWGSTSEEAMANLLAILRQDDQAKQDPTA